MRTVANVLEIAICSMFSNHVYRYGGRIYKQTKGGPIGLRLTGVVARVVMDRWARKFTNHLRQAQIVLQLLVKYVDDVNLALRAIQPNLMWSEDWKLVPAEPD